jgi:preprotein translocase subunit SecF
MELIPHNPSINFIKYKNLFITGSIVINLLVLIAAGIWSLNWGVDFKGGAEIEVKFAAPVNDVAVRQAVEAAGFNEATVQVFGPPSDNAFLIRVGRISLLSKEKAAQVEQALRAKLGADLATFDFNEEFGDKIELRFKKDVPAADQVRAIIESTGIRVQPGEEGMHKLSGGYTVITSGISDKVKAALAEAHTKNLVPASELQRIEFVGPQVGRQLRNKGIQAVLYAAVAILAYVALRFDTRFAPGAVIAMFHDIIVVLGYFVFSRREFNLTSVAVLLTIVGYSVNDTIVIYDRIRENMGKVRGMALPQLINMSLNETLARTILTSFATALSLMGLLIFGVGQIWDFAAAMIVGIITGTYSSIYIASPVTIWLEELAGKGGGPSRLAAPPPPTNPGHDKQSKHEPPARSARA